MLVQEASPGSRIHVRFPFPMKIAVALAGLTFLVFSQAYAAAGPESNWSRFRGPDGSGVAKGITLPAEFKGEIWKSELPGNGTSSPVVWGERVFLTADSAEKPGTLLLLAYELKDGKEAWRYEVPYDTFALHKFNNAACATPVADAERVYVQFTSGEKQGILAVTHAGKEVWKIGELCGFDSEHGSGASPVIIDDVLIVSSENTMAGASNIYGLEPKTGKKLWTLPRPAVKTSFSTPASRKLAEGGHEVIISTTATGFAGIDPKTGKVRWEYKPGDLSRRAVGSPTLLGPDSVFATFGEGSNGKESMAVRTPSPGGGGAATATPIFRFDKDIPYVPSPVAADGLLYFVGDNGIMHCCKATDGTRIYSERIGLPVFSSPIIVGDKVYVASKNGVLFALATGTTFKLLGKTELGEPVNATPAVTADSLIVRGEKHLWRLGGK